MMNDFDISVIVAGKIGNLNDFNNCITSIRNILPSCTIIVSTWDDIDFNNKDFILIKNKMLEPVRSKNGEISNITRQILLMQTALKYVTTEYVLKFRPDLVLQNKQLIENYKNGKIVTTNLFVPNPLRDPTLFHISDIVQFSTYKNIRDFWDININKINIDRKEKLKIIGNFSGNTKFRMLPEQILTINWFNKNLNEDIYLPYINYSSFEYVNLWINNIFIFFTIVPYSSSGVIFPGRFFKTRYKRYLLSDSFKNNFLFSVTNGKIAKLRYLIFIFNKYILCWSNRNYYFSLLQIFIGIIKGKK